MNTPRSCVSNVGSGRASVPKERLGREVRCSTALSRTAVRGAVLQEMLPLGALAVGMFLAIPGIFKHTGKFSVAFLGAGALIFGGSLYASSIQVIPKATSSVLGLFGAGLFIGGMILSAVHGAMSSQTGRRRE